MDHKKLDRNVARFAWIVIFMALAGVVAYVMSSHDPLSTILLAVFFPAIFGIIAYLFSPVDKKIMVHLLQEWPLALTLLVVLAAGSGSVLLHRHHKQAVDPKQVIKIGVDLPLTGIDKADGSGVRDAIQMAVADAGNLGDYHFEVRALSDDNTVTKLNDADVGAANVTTLLRDPQVAGIVGPFNSGVALKEIPIVNGASAGHQKIALVSPSTTADCLTTHSYSSDDCNDLNNSGSFFRLAALNGKAGEVFANCLSAPSAGPNDLCYSPNFHRYKTVAVIQDGTIFSVGFAQSFRQYWVAKDSSNKAAAEEVSNKASKASLADALKNTISELGATPDIVFFAGSEDNARQLHEIMQASPQQGLADLSHTPFASDAAIMNADFVAHLRQKKQTAPVYTEAPIKNLDTPNTDEQKDSRTFIDRYRQKYKAKPTPYAAAGYDATRILIQATKEAAGKGGVPDPKDAAAVQDFRNKIIYSIKHPIDDAVTGVTGRYSFDEHGDYRDAAVSVFEWNPSNSGNQNGWDYK